MMLSRILLAALALPALAFAANGPNPVLSRYAMGQADLATMNQIATRFEIESRHGNTFEVLVPTTETASFLALAPNAELLEWDICAKLKEQVAANDRSGWHDFDT